LTFFLNLSNLFDLKFLQSPFFSKEFFLVLFSQAKELYTSFVTFLLKILLFAGSLTFNQFLFFLYHLHLLE
jgi:hypothetical protein